MAGAYDYRMPNRTNAEFKRFSADYFSGADMRVYFGNTWIDELTQLQFNLVENVAPIFGYASYTFDAVARGSRQVQGTFRINFKEAYYLHSITNRLELETRQRQSSDNNLRAAGSVNVEQLLSRAGNQSEAEFERLAQQFEESLWGASTDNNMQTRANTRGSDSYFYPAGPREQLAKNGFNILILYGPYDVNQRTPGVSVTAHSITGVQLTGVQQVVDGSGQPIQEEYSFIARDLDVNANQVGK